MALAGEDLSDKYRGLVYATARRYVGFIDMDFDDLSQELWIKVMTARRRYDPDRSDMSERSYVFMAITNKVKDLKRDTVARRKRGRGSEADIADVSYDDEVRLLAQSHEETYGCVDEGLFKLPSTLSTFEVDLIVLLTLDFNQTEAAQHLGVPRTRIRATIASVREKMADWRPERSGELALIELVPRTAPTQAAA